MHLTSIQKDHLKHCLLSSQIQLLIFKKNKYMESSPPSTHMDFDNLDLSFSITLLADNLVSESSLVLPPLKVMTKTLFLWEPSACSSPEGLLQIYNLSIPVSVDCNIASHVLIIDNELILHQLD